ncbi:DNA-binding protein inhibitor ID-4 [Tachyglossus aculeatus]|uniref:DNA-binding protein inhibitor ID-4 n=1 Tax=Tachyglossus aculeatus TaxID=9261 RepID=UPI0018F69B59|nr:DNA-binding protein inhibitor ID-4 [Tachyglossus aculeatus]
MKAVSPGRRPPGRRAPAGLVGELGRRGLAEPGPGARKPAGSPEEAAAAAEEEAAAAANLCLQCDMNDCYSRLRKLVPTIPPNKKVSKVEILQHVIDYILDLQLALDTHPALLRAPTAPDGTHGPQRTPLTALNNDPSGPVNKQGDSILCR